MKRLATLTLAGSLSVALAATLSSPATASSPDKPPPADRKSSAASETVKKKTPAAQKATEEQSAAASEAADEVTTTTTSNSANSKSTTLKSLDHDDDRLCESKSFVRVNTFRPRNFFVPRTRFIDGPGGEMNVSVVRQHRVYLELEIEDEKLIQITKGDLLRQLRKMINPLVAEEHIVETGHQYTQAISDGMYGNMWYRVFGYRVGFSAWRRVSNCDVVPVATGIANVPSRVEGWKYWETKHPMFRGRRL